MPRPPLVFVPGFPASSLELREGHRKVFIPKLEDLTSAKRKAEVLKALQGPDDPDADDGVDAVSPIRYSLELPLFDLGKEAQSLYDLLEQSFGYDTQDPSQFRPVGWDWRRRVDGKATQAAVEGAISDLFQAQGQRVVAIVHSTGGLVIRALLEKKPALADKLLAIIALGVPWAGVVASFPQLAFGVKVGFGPVQLLSAKESRDLMTRAHAAYDLLPPDPAKTDMTDPEGRPLGFFTANGTQVSPLVDTRWFKPSEAHMVARAQAADQRLGTRTRTFRLGQRPPIQILNLAGWGCETLTHGELAQKKDGKAPWVETSTEGDGTVPFRSASWLRGEGIQTFFIPVGVYGDQLITQRHSQLWNTPPARSLLGRYLDAGAAAEPHAWAAVDRDDAIDRRRRVRVRATAADATGKPLPAASVRLRVPGNPRLDLSGRLRGEIDFSRQGLRPNVGTRFFRFEAEFDLGGTAVKRALIIEL